MVKKRGRKSVKEEEWEKLNMTERIERITEILKDATRELKQEPAKDRKVNFSEETKEILERREKAIEEGNEEEYDRLTKEFKKSKSKDKRDGISKGFAPAAGPPAIDDRSIVD